MSRAIHSTVSGGAMEMIRYQLAQVSATSRRILCNGYWMAVTRQARLPTSWPGVPQVMDQPEWRKLNAMRMSCLAGAGQLRRPSLKRSCLIDKNLVRRWRAGGVCNGNQCREHRLPANPRHATRLPHSGPWWPSGNAASPPFAAAPNLLRDPQRHPQRSGHGFPPI